VQSNFDADSYFGICRICGHSQEFAREMVAIRETYRCAKCKALLREREQAQAILSCYGTSRIDTLEHLAGDVEFRKLRIYEPGTIGPFRRLFTSLPYYQQSDYYPEDTRDSAPLKVPHQSLEALSYADKTFDLVITSDILEHVRRPERAFSEIARVLKPGGRHIFTVPLQEPLPEKTVMRVDTSGPVDRPILPDHYHGNGKGGRSLVYTDFGMDIVEMLSSAGFAAELRRPYTESPTVNRVRTVVSRRLA
jgi:SAM-dependent methyltransferase